MFNLWLTLSRWRLISAGLKIGPTISFMVEKQVNGSWERYSVTLLITEGFGLKHPCFAAQPLPTIDLVTMVYCFFCYKLPSFVCLQRSLIGAWHHAVFFLDVFNTSTVVWSLHAVHFICPMIRWGGLLQCSYFSVVVRRVIVVVLHWLLYTSSP